VDSAFAAMKKALTSWEDGPFIQGRHTSTPFDRMARGAKIVK
jgi:hypothetical protein